MGLNEQIRSAISRLHERESSDYESLLSQVENRRREVVLNLPQMMASICRTPMLLLEWGRGTGKTTMRGARWSNKLRLMPRSTGLLIGPSYQFLLTRILPSLVQGLEMFGIYKDLHYFVGRRPPRSWRRSWGNAYQPPEEYNRYITFWNGMGVHLISQDVSGDGRGLNVDWIDGDEAALLDPRKLQENTDPTLRGTRKQAFEDCYLFGSRFYTSSTPLTPEGQWFTEYEEKALADPKSITFIAATCRYNQPNLRKGYLEEARRDAYAEWVYLAEYENKRPRFTKDSFYSQLDSDIHCYTPGADGLDFYERIGHTGDCRGDADLVKGTPLVLGVDWGAAINCLTVNQHLRSLNEYRTLKSMYVLGEDQKMQDDLVRDFHAYYQPHQASCKTIYLWYDASGNHRTGNTRVTRAEQARQLLRSLGWEVNLMTPGHFNPMHDDKYRLWEIMLRGDTNVLPRYRMNKLNCKELYMSMRFAKTAPGRNGEIKKDKSSERSGKVQRQHATDLSDANDTPIFGMFYHLLRHVTSSLPDVRTVGG